MVILFQSCMLHASSFITNMCVKQNAQDHAVIFPLAAKAIEDFNGLACADSSHLTREHILWKEWFPVTEIVSQMYLNRFLVSFV